MPGTRLALAALAAAITLAVAGCGSGDDHPHPHPQPARESPRPAAATSYVVFGDVEDDASGTGATGLSIFFDDDDDGASYEAVTDDTASYRIELPPGTYTVSCAIRACLASGSTGGEADATTVTITGVQEVDLEILAPPAPDDAGCSTKAATRDDAWHGGDTASLWCGGSAVVTVTAAFVGGSPPCAGVPIWVHRVSPDNAVAVAGQTGDDGTYTASGLPAGTYVIENPNVGLANAAPLINGTEAVAAQVVLGDGQSSHVAFACN